MGKLLIGIGILFIFLGILWHFGVPLGRLPGDIAIEKGNSKFYFPIVTCLVISLVVTVALHLFRRFF